MAKAVKTTGKKPATSRKTSDKPPAADPLIVSISGIRGIAGTSFSPASILPFVDAFARLQEGKRRVVVIGRDARPSSKWVMPFVTAILRSHGIDVADADLCPTPTVGLLTRKLKASGGICITASHNPIEYNGLKFFQSNGQFITAEILEKLKDLMANPVSPVSAPQVGQYAQFDQAAELHLKALISAIPPPARTRGVRAPHVIIDCCNSAAARLAPDVADAYGAAIQIIHADTKVCRFPRGAEPTPENISALRKAVVKERADIGFAIDPDADRLALVDETGRAIGEERTIVLAADAYLTLCRKSPLVVNLSTTRAMEDVAAKHKVKLYRTAIGEANVVRRMTALKARIGGEGNGGVIVPQVQPGRDAATAIALILLGLQARGELLSEWNASIPEYTMKKVSVPLGDLSVKAALSAFSSAFKNCEQDSTDGIKVSMEDRWVHLRASNTEPIVRIFAEAPDEDGAEELLLKATAAIR